MKQHHSAASASGLPRMPPTPRANPIVGALKLFALLAGSYLESLWQFAKRSLGIGRRQISGRVVLVTGAAQGIGLAAAEMFARQKCVTVLTDVSSKVHEAAKSLSAQGLKAASYQLDVTRPSAIADCLADVVQRFGRLDVVVSNAGVLQGKSLFDLSDDQIRTTIDVNLLGTIWVTRAALPYMIQQREGHIVYVVSMSSCMGVAFTSDYSASKFGAYGFIETVEDELRRMGLYRDAGGIYLTTVCPTFLDPKAGGVLVNKPVLPGYGTGKMLTPNCVAKKIVEAIQFRRRFICVPENLAVHFVARGLVPWRAARAIQDFDGSYFDEQ